MIRERVNGAVGLRGRFRLLQYAVPERVGFHHATLRTLDDPNDYLRERLAVASRASD